MSDRRVWIFFYGSYMNMEVLHEVDIAPRDVQVARLPGFDIRVAPRANLVRCAEHAVYGVLATVTHAELDKLYAHAQHVLGEVYLPEAVVCITPDGSMRAALCYIADEMRARVADPAYVQRILAPARKHGFPEWYIQRIDRYSH